MAAAMKIYDDDHDDDDVPNWESKQINDEITKEKLHVRNMLIAAAPPTCAKKGLVRVLRRRRIQAIKPHDGSNIKNPFGN